MKNMKKAVGFLCAALMGVSAFTACQPAAQDEKKIMNVALNPEVEFVLDKDDKVVSVNALNEEGNLIISGEVFIGKSAEEAVKLFVEISKETGFLVTGKVNAGENEISISLSGDETAAQALYDDVKATVSEYLTQENVTATIGYAAQLTEEYLQELVEKCAPYVDATKMEYAELIETIQASREETAEFYSQELKNAYYEAKAFVMEQTEMQAVKVQANITGMAATMFDIAYQGYTTAVSVIENTRMTMLVHENSPYQVALAAFREAKADYLEYRNYVASLEENEITTAISTQLAQYQTYLDQAETSLTQAGVTANGALDTAKAQVQTAYNTVVAAIEEYSAKVSQFASEIGAKQQEAQTQFFTEFETDYAAAVEAAKTSWENMKGNLKNKDTENAA